MIRLFLNSYVSVVLRVLLLVAVVGQVSLVWFVIVLWLVTVVDLLDLVQICFSRQGWPEVGPRWDMRPRGKSTFFYSAE